MNEIFIMKYLVNLNLRIYLALLLSGFIFIILGTPSEIEAQVSVDRIIFRFEYGKSPVQNVLVRNNGDEAVHITAISEIVERAGFPDEHRVEASNLILSPKRFSIQPKGERVVRLLIKNPTLSKDKEQVYRVKFMPQAQGFDESIVAERAGRKAMVKVLFSVGILVFDEPELLKPEVSWTREGNKIILSNSGNANVYLDEGKACLTKEEETCVPLASNRLYPENNLEVIAPSDAHYVSFRQTIGAEHSMITITP
jgi:P pilus assembly chaperone PapD